MKEVNNISRVYFLGIGGIGMSALARYFLERNIIVSGYDRTSTPLTRSLEREGANIHYEDNVKLLDRESEMVIYTPAIPEGHTEMAWYQEQNYPMLKRSELLNQITASSYNICVAGTHGKTTLSTMIAHILRDSGYGCNAFLGGLAVNYNTNYWSSPVKVNVIEADEYDRSFLKLSPGIAVITAMDADHLDIYGSVENMREAFREFSLRLRDGGLLLTKFGISHESFEAPDHRNYSLQNSSADIFAENITLKKGGYQFDVKAGSWELSEVQLNIGGMHNVENMVAAIGIARYLEIEADKIKKAVENFKGVKRRFEYVIDVSTAEKQVNNVVFIDDYAHHPEELKALINSAKTLFEKRKCTVIFQPHLYSRTRDFYKEFAASLDLADEVLLMPIYPARELPLEGVSSEMILKEMKQKNTTVLSAAQILQYISGGYLETVQKSSYGQLLITAGAGSIDQLAEPLKQIIGR